MSEPEPQERKVGPFWVRLCRGTHYHVTTEIGDILTAPASFKTDDEAWEACKREAASVGEQEKL